MFITGYTIRVGEHGPKFDGAFANYLDIFFFFFYVSTPVLSIASFVTIFVMKFQSPTVIDCMSFSIAMLATFVSKFVGWIVVTTLKSDSNGKVLCCLLHHLSLYFILDN